ncbi:MAG: alpha-ketoglutarate-dependent dioxygenase AlkB [Nannocystaceae bacterium]|nr:alpha-ketoglutarate-dependent dioxygenase AlkB [Nannocystaceae bacterium]
MCTYPDITITDDFLDDHAALFSQLVASIDWDEGMYARKTASFGVPYDGPGAAIHRASFPHELQRVADRLGERLGWRPNSCWLHYFAQRRSALAMRAEPTDTLDPGSGVAIVSTGATRVMVFERDDGSDVCGRELRPGSLLVTGLASQRRWRHGVPARAGVGPRISLTFRRVLGQRCSVSGSSSRTA